MFEIIAPCHFGIEAVLKKEIYDLGYDIKLVEDGRITFYGDEEAICRANICLRTAERIMIQIGRFRATTYDELFEGIKELEWSKYIPQNGKFWVKKASSIKSKLFSPSDIQSVVKKAIVEKLKTEYHIEWFNEDGNEYPIRVFIFKDEVIVGLDTSGDSLHKRGYRKLTAKAPISETLAAALIMLTPWRWDRILVDPFCGSGTFPIEAALMAKNIAPGLSREFTAMKWTNLIKENQWKEIRDEMREEIISDRDMDIQGYDMDGEIVKAARKNAMDAGVDDVIHFQQREVAALSHPKKYGFIITNPPYGERLEDKENLFGLYKTIGDRYKNLDSWSAYIISSYEDVEKAMGIKATKNRKLYNGMIKTYYYQFAGPKPPRMNKEEHEE